MDPVDKLMVCMLVSIAVAIAFFWKNNVVFGFRIKLIFSTAEDWILYKSLPTYNALFFDLTCWSSAQYRRKYSRRLKQ